MNIIFVVYTSLRIVGKNVNSAKIGASRKFDQNYHMTIRENKCTLCEGFGDFDVTLENALPW